jgi:hypothetical protein
MTYFVREDSTQECASGNAVAGSGFHDGRIINACGSHAEIVVDRGEPEDLRADRGRFMDDDPHPEFRRLEVTLASVGTTPVRDTGSAREPSNVKTGMSEDFRQLMACERERAAVHNAFTCDA